MSYVAPFHQQHHPPTTTTTTAANLSTTTEKTTTQLIITTTTTTAHPNAQHGPNWKKTTQTTIPNVGVFCGRLSQKSTAEVGKLRMGNLEHLQPLTF